MSKSSQYIHCEVHVLQTGLLFYTTFVYGSNDLIERQELWNSLLNFKTNSPWVSLGDFNAIRSPKEKNGGLTHWPPHMDEFKNCLYSCEVDDLRFSSCYFTWSNKQDFPNHISSKIDRVSVNEG